MMKLIKYSVLPLLFLLLFSDFSHAQLIHDFKVNDDTAGSVFRHYANISTNKNGLSAIVWSEYVLGNIYAQVYDNNFVKINNNFKVNTGIDSSTYPDIIINDREKIGVVWQKENAFANFKCGTYFRLFDKYGNPLTQAIRLNDTLKSYYGYPRIGCDSIRRFIVVWEYSQYDIYFQILDSIGNKIGNNIKVNDDNTHGFSPDVLVKKDGSFIITWKDSRYSGDNIYMQMFNKNGSPIGVNQKVNDSIAASFYSFSTPKIAQDSSDNFTIAFNVYTYNDNSDYIKYQRYDKNGVKLGQNKNLPYPGQMVMTSFDCDKEGNLIFQINYNNAAIYYVYNIRMDKNDNPIGTYFPVSNEYINSGKAGEDIKLHNKKIINIWRDSRLTPQPQIYANVRSYINPDSTVGIVNISNEIPEKYKLYQNYPNPFNPRTNIKYQITNSKNVSLRVYDLLGRDIATLVNEKQTPGIYEVSFDGSNFATGVYFYRIQSGDFVQVKKMILVK